MLCAAELVPLRSSMRLALLSLSLWSMSCAMPYVVIPNTRAGLACKRECMLVENSCHSGGRSWADVAHCDDQADECLWTCPGARWSDEVAQAK